MQGTEMAASFPVSTPVYQQASPGATASGVKLDSHKNGDGINFPKPGDKVSIHYVGTLTRSGTKFDSSIDRGQPFECQIGVGAVIKGWDEAIPKMSVGEKATLQVSSDYGYGAVGAGNGVIPPNSDLTFEVELLKIL